MFLPVKYVMLYYSVYTSTIIPETSLHPTQSLRSRSSPRKIVRTDWYSVGSRGSVRGSTLLPRGSGRTQKVRGARDRLTGHKESVQDPRVLCRTRQTSVTRYGLSGNTVTDGREVRFDPTVVESSRKNLERTGGRGSVKINEGET